MQLQPTDTIDRICSDCYEAYAEPGQPICEHCRDRRDAELRIHYRCHGCGYGIALENGLCEDCLIDFDRVALHNVKRLQDYDQHPILILDYTLRPHHKYVGSLSEIAGRQPGWVHVFEGFCCNVLAGGPGQKMLAPMHKYREERGYAFSEHAAEGADNA